MERQFHWNMKSKPEISDAAKGTLYDDYITFLMHSEKKPVQRNVQQ
jgi:hypothetical protein